MDSIRSTRPFRFTALSAVQTFLHRDRKLSSNVPRFFPFLFYFPLVTVRGVKRKETKRREEKKEEVEEEKKKRFPLSWSESFFFFFFFCFDFPFFYFFFFFSLRVKDRRILARRSGLYERAFFDRSARTRWNFISFTNVRLKYTRLVNACNPSRRMKMLR